MSRIKHNYKINEPFIDQISAFDKYVKNRFHTSFLSYFTLSLQKYKIVGSFTFTCYIFNSYLILTSNLNKLQNDKLNDVMITFKNIGITQRQTGPHIFLVNFKYNDHI